MSKKSRRVAKARRALFTLSLVMVMMVVAVGGTMAWLTSETSTITNTFTPAGVEIALTETMNTDTNNDGTNDAWTAQLIPGMSYPKNPKVEVIRSTYNEDGSVKTQGTDVDIYLFVEYVDTTPAVLTKTSTLTSNNGWTLVNGETNVWWREVKATDTLISWELLEGNSVSIANTVTKSNTNVGGTMTYTAYAIQTEGFATPELAWAEVSK